MSKILKNIGSAIYEITGIVFGGKAFMERYTEYDIVCF